MDMVRPGHSPVWIQDAASTTGNLSHVCSFMMGAAFDATLGSKAVATFRPAAATLAAASRLAVPNLFRRGQAKFRISGDWSTARFYRYRLTRQQYSAYSLPNAFRR
jgi:hypothetical protein